MDILTSLNSGSDYSKTQLEFIIGAWVMSQVIEKKSKILTGDGHVEESDYDKASLYALLYPLYRAVGELKVANGESFEMTFNTWGYAWPEAWGKSPISDTDPQRFGKNAYAGLYEAAAVKARLKEARGKVHIVEMGCGTGAGAHLICSKILPECTYEAVDMQSAAIATCNRKFVGELRGRLKATCADATSLNIKDGTADIVAVNETHVTEVSGVVTNEDERFFKTALRILKPGGFLVWGNAIPTPTWKACFDYLGSIGLKQTEARDVTKEAVAARDQDEPRVEQFVKHCLDSFWGFRIPVLGPRRRYEAERAVKNFYRNPGTRLYTNMKDGTDTYMASCFQKQ
jgi:ubiquinone/menaquinone biosynthesis C-methylase UbiE